MNEYACKSCIATGKGTHLVMGAEYFGEPCTFCGAIKVEVEFYRRGEDGQWLSYDIGLHTSCQPRSDHRRGCGGLHHAHGMAGRVPDRLMPPGTTLRNVRIPDELWDAALTRAERDNTSVSEVIRELLQQWVDG